MAKSGPMMVLQERAERRKREQAGRSSFWKSSRAAESKRGLGLVG